jgi:hypothetical protein
MISTVLDLAMTQIKLIPIVSHDISLKVMKAIIVTVGVGGLIKATFC